MARGGGLGTVVRFEYRRTALKPSFWIVALFVPVIVTISVFISASTGRAASQREAELSSGEFAFEYLDASGVIVPELAKALGGEPGSSREAGIAAVESGELEAFFAFPAAPDREPVEIWAVNAGPFENSKYGGVAEALLRQSALQAVGSAELAAILATAPEIELVSYEAGEPVDVGATMVPGVLLLMLFYFLIFMLGNQALLSTLEEKENRVTEMLLTTTSPTRFLSGKILAILLVGCTQIALVLLPLLAAYLLFAEELALPELQFELVDPVSVLTGLAIIIAGLFLLIALFAGIGAAVPSVKESGSIFGAVAVLLMFPFFFGSTFISDPDAPIVQFLLYFPPTAPISALGLNALGHLAAWQALVVIVELVAFGLLAFRIAIELFRAGSLEYARVLSPRRTFDAMRRAIRPRS